MATQETIDVLSRNCNEEYCSIKEFFRRHSQNHHLLNVDCSGCHGERECEAKKTIRKVEDRMLFQFKEIELFKLFESKTERRDIGWTEAAVRWINRGYAQRFFRVYDQEKSRDPLYVFSCPSV